MNDSSIETKPHGTDNTAGEKAPVKSDDVSIAQGQQIQVEDAMPGLKEAEALDPFGNEEGADIHCELFLYLLERDSQSCVASACSLPNVATRR
jgi:hypothetical protein